MPAAPTRIRSDLRLILGDGLSHSFMVGVGETYLAAFALALGMSAMTAGFVATLPLAAGGLMQLVTSWGVRRMGGYRPWIVSCAVLQALTFLPLIGVALLGWPPWLLFVAAAVYWGAGMATSPAWNSWIGQLVPAGIRARFFGVRQSATQIGVLAGVVVGGSMLHAGGAGGATLAAFATLFGLAFAARSASALILSRQGRARPVRPHPEIGVRTVARGLMSRDWGRVLRYVVLANAATYLVGPFVTPFLLDELGLSYGAYMILIASSFAAKIGALPLMGALARRVGGHWLLSAGALGIAPLPILWILSDAFAVLLLAHMLTGIAWAAFELGTFLVFFDVTDRRERTSVLALLNGANALAIAGGSIAGGLTLHLLGGGRDAYIVLFAVSVVARFAARAALPRTVASPPTVRVPALRVLGVGPTVGVTRPVLASVEDAESDPDGGQEVRYMGRKGPRAATG